MEDEAGDVPLRVRPGDRRLGRILKHRGKMNVFDPKKYHSVDACGDRWSITAFRTRSSEHLKIEEKRHLEGFGFSLQGYRGHPLSHDGLGNKLGAATK